MAVGLELQGVLYLCGQPSNSYFEGKRMRMKLNQLKRVIREAVGRQLVKLSYGNKEVPWGSPEHLADLEGDLRDLVMRRNSTPRGSQQRDTLARAIKEKRAQIRSASRSSHTQQA